MAFTLARLCSVWAVMPWGISPVAGLIGIWPEAYTNVPVSRAAHRRGHKVVVRFPGHVGKNGGYVLVGDESDNCRHAAAEKAGIIKPNVPVVIGEASGSVRDVFRNAAAAKGSPAIFACDNPLFTSAVSDGDTMRRGMRVRRAQVPDIAMRRRCGRCRRCRICRFCGAASTARIFSIRGLA